MPLNVIGTALQLQHVEACTLFYTFICSFYSAIQLLFYKHAGKLDNRDSRQNKEQSI